MQDRYDRILPCENMYLSRGLLFIENNLLTTESYLGESTNLEYIPIYKVPSSGGKAL